MTMSAHTLRVFKEPKKRKPPKPDPETRKRWYWDQGDGEALMVRVYKVEGKVVHRLTILTTAATHPKMMRDIHSMIDEKRWTKLAGWWAAMVLCHETNQGHGDDLTPAQWIWLHESENGGKFF